MSDPLRGVSPAAVLQPPPPDLLGRASLFLDFDGTLVELAETPDAVIVPPRLTDLLAALVAAMEGRVAIVSGRSVESVIARLGRGLPISGSHGLEVAWPDGRRAGPPPPAWLPDARIAAEGLAARYPGMHVEVKPFGLALHYRQAPDAERECLDFARAIAGDQLNIQPGKMVVEISLPGASKGVAVRTMLADPVMAGGIPVFFGDDLTDEAAFVVAEALGGVGVLVGAPRPSAARYRLDGVTATLAWLEQATRVTA